eukprot:607241-Pelagomonas_calceolata.AAC.3
MNPKAPAALLHVEKTQSLHSASSCGEDAKPLQHLVTWTSQHIAAHNLRGRPVPDLHKPSTSTCFITHPAPHYRHPCTTPQGRNYGQALGGGGKSPSGR